jgi:hypothetical protein
VIVSTILADARSLRRLRVDWLASANTRDFGLAVATPRLAKTQHRGSAGTLVSTINLVFKAAETAGGTEGTLKLSTYMIRRVGTMRR